jgi:signal transduction histidine kinase/phage shock protein PspC (stress-responsive transcriptional regulator)
VSTAATPTLVRRTNERRIAGVAAGFAHATGAPARVVRAVFVLTGLMGIGVAVYVIAWVVLPDDAGGPPVLRRLAPHDPIDVVALVAVIVGALLAVARFGFSLPGSIVFPIVVAGVGLALLLRWPGGDEEIRPADLPDWLPPAAQEAVGALGTRRGLVLRATVGTILVLGGITALLASTSSWASLRDGLLALLVVISGLALVFGPWLSRLGSELVAERRARIRERERAEMAAHLHDSVLQTLAMVQRRADDPREVMRLARKQERELRTWLQSGQPVPSTDTAPGTVGAAIAELAGELEDLHGVAVEVVQVRDCTNDAALEPLLLATREAIVNAQCHSGADTVDVYCEVDDDTVRVYVRDRGTGFDPGAVAEDRRGITESIRGRMARHGGAATLRSTPGEGTEVELTIPRARPRRELEVSETNKRQDP